MSGFRVGVCLLWLSVAGFCQTGEPTRPKILGVAHIGLRTDDLAAARKFYGALLGYQEPFTYSEGGNLLLTYFKVNDHQYIEVFPELKDPQQDRLSHISFETSDAEQLRAYLASKGVKVPDKLDPMGDGNRGFEVADPDGTQSNSSSTCPDRYTAKILGSSCLRLASLNTSFT